MRGVAHPRPKQHCPPDSGLAASCCHFFLFRLSSCSPPGSFVERRTRSCQSIRTEINQKGTIGRTWASLPPPVPRSCADARFSSIKILNSAIPFDNPVSKSRTMSGTRREEEGEGRDGDEGVKGHVP